MGSLAVGRESQGAISVAAFVVPDGQHDVPHVPANGIGALDALLDRDDMSVDRRFFIPLSLLEPEDGPAGCPAGYSGCSSGDSTPFAGAATPTPPDHHARQRLEQLDDEPLVERWTYVPQTALSIDSRSPRDFAFHLPFRFLQNTKQDQNTNIGTFLDDSSNLQSGSSERHLPDLGLDEYGPFYLDVDLPRSPVYRSFYLSPSASTTSLASEPCTYHHYFDNSSSGISSIRHGAIMPDVTAMASPDGAGPVGPSGPSGRPNYAAKTIAQRRQRRPHSAHSEQLARLPSPFFSLWTKRHHHHHHHHQSHMDHNGKPQEPLEYPGHGFTDTKPTTHKRFTHSRSSSIGTRQNQANAVPQMTREEFEALPLAIQRKVCTRVFLERSPQTLYLMPAWRDLMFMVFEPSCFPVSLIFFFPGHHPSLACPLPLLVPAASARSCIFHTSHVQWEPPSPLLLSGDDTHQSTIRASLPPHQ